MFLKRRRRACAVVLAACWAAWSLAALRWSGAARRALQPPPPPAHDLAHLSRATSLALFVDDIQVLIEPSSPCEDEDLPIVILVTSSPDHVAQRHAVRSTWGDRQPTYFLVGLQGKHIDENLVDNYVEAKQFGDMIIVDMPDHYQNLTLKTALMLRWTLARCAHARYMIKTDDDVLINPWSLKTLLQEHSDAKLIGYRVNNRRLHRDEYSKWFVPRWLERRDVIPQYLSGTGYIVNGKYLEQIYKAALRTPLINLEDVYLTYLVAKTALNFDLTHDRRLSPYKPWVPFDCAYWNLALAHSLQPSEIVHAWARIQRIAHKHERDENVCAFYRDYLETEWLLY